MLALPQETHIADSHVILKEKNGYFHLSMDDSSNIRYQTGLISESRGMYYLDILTPHGSMTFVFSTLEKLLTFLVKHADSDFIDLE